MDKRPELVKSAEFYSSFFWLLDCLFGLLANALDIKHLFTQLQISVLFCPLSFFLLYHIASLIHLYSLLIPFLAFQSLSSDENKVIFAKQTKDNIDATIIDLFRNFLDIPVSKLGSLIASSYLIIIIRSQLVLCTRS